MDDSTGNDSISALLAIVQDPAGFMWFGGENGLARYDGHEFRIYQADPENSNALSGNYIWDLIVDKTGVMWVATSVGLNRYNPETDDFSLHIIDTYQSSGTLVLGSSNSALKMKNRSDIVGTLAVAEDNTLFVGTANGLVVIEPDRQNYVNHNHNPDDPTSMNHPFVRTVYIDDDGTTWVGTQAGLNVFNDDGTFTRYAHDPNDPESLSEGDVLSIRRCSRGYLWVGTFGGGLNRMNSDGTFRRYAHDPSNKRSLLANTVWDIVEDQDKNVWFATDPGGLVLYQAETDDFKAYVSNDYDDGTLISNSVRTVFEDGQGDLWVGTFPFGVNFFDRSMESFLRHQHRPDDKNSLSHSAVTALMEASDGSIWVGTEKGLNRYDKATGQFQRILSDHNNPYSLRVDTILSIDEAANGDLWVGTWSGGLHRYDRDEQRFYNYSPAEETGSKLAGDKIWSLKIDSRARIWAGTESAGLNLYDPKTDRFNNYMPDDDDSASISLAHVWSLMEDRQKRLWVGTLHGLDIYDEVNDGFLHFYHDPDDPTTVSSRRIIALMEARDGRVWIGTQDRGLNIYDPETKKFTALGIKAGLPSTQVTSLVQDLEGFIWATTVSGVVRIHPDTLNIRVFTKNNGLAGNNFNRNASLIDKEGTLYLGGIDGLTIFDPKVVHSPSEKSPVVITDFRLFNRSVPIRKNNSPLEKVIDYTDKLNLRYDHSMFSFEFSILSYRGSKDNRYAYKLEGFDKEWNEVGNRNTATYTNIDPGVYVFKVRGANRDGIWTDDIKSVDIIVSTPPWKSSWAIALYASVCIFLVFLLVKMQVKKVELDNERSVNAKLMKLDKLKDTFLANTSHELRTPLNGIIGIADSLIASESELKQDSLNKLNIISSSGKRLSYLINDILDYSKLSDHKLDLNFTPVELSSIVFSVFELLFSLTQKKPVNLVSNVSDNLPTVSASESRLQQILLNLVGNAIKYTDEGDITVDASYESGEVWVSVTDSGIGIPDVELNTIFKAFTQVEHGDTREYGGTGLGLAITKQLVELHGGQIFVESIENVGSKFTFTLKISTADDIQREQTRQYSQPLISDDNHSVGDYRYSLEDNGAGEKIEQYQGDESIARNQALTDSADKIEENLKKAQAESLATSKPVPSPARNKKYTVLIVDDDSVNRMVLESILEPEGYHVVEASSGYEAIEYLAKDEHVSLVILDVMMPRMSGYETCQVIRLMYSKVELPIVFLTAKNAGDDMSQGFEIGGNDFLNKPVSKLEIIPRVANHINLRDIHFCELRYEQHLKAMLTQLKDEQRSHMGQKKIVG